MREEVIKSALKFLIRKQTEQGSWGYANNDNTNKVSWNEVLEWIDQRSCGDLISRQAALNALEALEQDAPSAKHASAIFDCEDTIKRLPSVEPERKTGKWIDYPFENVYGLKLRDYRCNLCAYFVNAKTKFCPNCGAKMEKNDDGI